MIISSVVLPAPDGPTTLTASPAARSSSMSRSTSTAPAAPVSVTLRRLSDTMERGETGIGIANEFGSSVGHFRTAGTLRRRRDPTDRQSGTQDCGSALDFNYTLPAGGRIHGERRLFALAFAGLGLDRATLLDTVVGPTPSAYVAGVLLAASWAAFPLAASPAVALAFATASLALVVLYLRGLDR